jgi:anti-sigma regulatory factor (Ser/Thr protein kinase)/anti-anti-sigma regulatory factor
MSQVRPRGEALRSFILDNVEAHPADIAKVAAEKFSVSRQAVNKHLRNLVAEKALVEKGSTRDKSYSLCPELVWSNNYLPTGLEEDVVWQNDVKPRLDVPENAARIWGYCITEMLNNAIDHSEARNIRIEIKKTATMTEIIVVDTGIGIFKKIMDALGLSEQNHALLELAKGKFTTDPSRHSGQGIFFTSRMVDRFYIYSRGTLFSHDIKDEQDWLTHHESHQSKSGTLVSMSLKNHTARTTKKVFDEFSTTNDDGFTKTVVPVRLSQYGDEQLVSRSQAKRLLARVDKFKTVVLDFEGVNTIGHSYADEIFRVFATANSAIELAAINTNDDVRAMVNQARREAVESSSTTQP